MHKGMMVLATALFVLPSCMSKTAYMKERNRADGLAQTLEDYKRYQDELDRENQAVRTENATLKGKVSIKEDLARKQKELDELLARLRTHAVGSSATPGVTVIQRDDQAGLRIEGGLLFASGKAELSSEGEATLRKLLGDLRQARGIQVEGHTDSDPIQASSWRSNLHLSAARALAVAHWLSAQGIPLDSISVEGFGASRPVDPADKARNRRVEIFLVQ